MSSEHPSADQAAGKPLLPPTDNPVPTTLTDSTATTASASSTTSASTSAAKKKKNKKKKKGAASISVAAGAALALDSEDPSPACTPTTGTPITTKTPEDVAAEIAKIATPPDSATEILAPVPEPLEAPAPVIDLSTPVDALASTTLLLPADEEQPDFGTHSSPFDAVHTPTPGVPAPMPPHASSLFADDAEGAAFEFSTDAVDQWEVENPADPQHINAYDTPELQQADSLYASGRHPELPPFVDNDFDSGAFETTATLETAMDVEGAVHEANAYIREADQLCATSHPASLFAEDNRDFDMSMGHVPTAEPAAAERASTATTTTTTTHQSDDVVVSSSHHDHLSLFDDTAEAMAFEIPTETEILEQSVGDDVGRSSIPKPISHAAATLFADDAEGMAFEIGVGDVDPVFKQLSQAPVQDEPVQQPSLTAQALFADNGSADAFDIAAHDDTVSGSTPAAISASAQPTTFPSSTPMNAASLFADDTDAFDIGATEPSPRAVQPPLAAVAAPTAPVVAQVTHKSVANLFTDSDFLVDTSFEDSFDLGRIDDRPISPPMQAPEEPEPEPAAQPAAEAIELDFEVPDGWYDDNGTFQWYTPEEKEAVRQSMLADHGYGATTTALNESDMRRTPEPTSDPYAPVPAAADPYAPPAANPYAPAPAAPANQYATAPVANPYAPAPVANAYAPTSTPQTNAYAPASPQNPYAPAAQTNAYAPPPQANAYASPAQSAYSSYQPAAAIVPPAAAGGMYIPGFQTAASFAAAPGVAASYGAPAPYDPYTPSTPVTGYDAPLIDRSKTPASPKSEPPKRMKATAYDAPFLNRAPKSRQSSHSHPAPIAPFVVPADAPPMPAMPAAPAAPPPGPPKRSPTHDSVPTVHNGLSAPSIPPRAQSAAPHMDPYSPTSAYDPPMRTQSPPVLQPYSASGYGEPYGRVASPPIQPPQRPATASATQPPKPTSFDPPLRQTTSRPPSRHASRPDFASPPLPAAALPPVPALPKEYANPRSAVTSPTMPTYAAFSPPPPPPKNLAFSPPPAAAFAPPPQQAMVSPPPLPPKALSPPPAKAMSPPPAGAMSPPKASPVAAPPKVSPPPHSAPPAGPSCSASPGFAPPPRAASPGFAPPPRSASPKSAGSATGSTPASPARRHVSHGAPPRVSSPLRQDSSSISSMSLAQAAETMAPAVASRTPKTSRIPLGLHEEADPEGHDWREEEHFEERVIAPPPQRAPPPRKASAAYEPAPLVPAPSAETSYEPAPYVPAPATESSGYEPAPYVPAPSTDTSGYEPAPYVPPPAEESSRYDPAPYVPAPAESSGYLPAPDVPAPAAESTYESAPYVPAPATETSSYEPTPYAPYSPPKASPSEPMSATRTPGQAEYNQYAPSSAAKAAAPPPAEYNPYGPSSSPVKTTSAMPRTEYNPYAPRQSQDWGRTSGEYGRTSGDFSRKSNDFSRQSFDAQHVYSHERNSSSASGYQPFSAATTASNPYAPSQNEYNPYASPTATTAPLGQQPSNNDFYSPANAYGANQRTASPPQEFSMSPPGNNYFQNMHLDATYVPQQILEQRPVSEDPLGRCTPAARNVPLAKFGFGGFLVTCFPGTSDDSVHQPTYGYGSYRGLLNIRPVSEVAEASALSTNETSFPGPLIFGAATVKGPAGDKKRRDGVLEYLAARAGEIERGLPYLKSSASRARREEEGKLAIVRILTAFVEGEGRLFGNPQAEEAVRAALQPPTTNAAVAPGVNGLGVGSVPVGGRATASQLAQLSAMAMRGDKREAAQFAAQAGLWSHALVISSSVDPELWREMVTRFTAADLAENPSTSGLKAAYTVYGGLTPANIDDLFRASNITGDSTADQWREVIASVLFNGKPTDLICLDDLGARYKKAGLHYTSHVCALLSPNSPFTDLSLAAAERAVPLLGNEADEDALIFAEIAEYARSLIPTPKGVEPPFPAMAQLLPYKLQRAWRAAELGNIDQARAYCEAIGTATEVTDKEKDRTRRLAPHLAAGLEDLLERLSGEPSVAPTKGLRTVGVRKAKSSATLGSWIEGRLTKFIAGEEDGEPTKPTGLTVKKDGAVGPFSHFSAISPSPAPSQPVSRAVSSVDMNQPPSAGSMEPPTPYQPASAGYNGGYQPWGGDDSASESATPHAVPATAVPTLNVEEQDESGFINPMGSLNFGTPSPAFSAPPSTADYNPPARQEQAFDDDDDDLGFGNVALSRARTPHPKADEVDNYAPSKAADKGKAKEEQKEEAKTAPATPAKGSWLGGWWGKKKPADSPEPQPQQLGSGYTKAHMGDEMSLVYDPELKRYVMKGQKAAPAAAAAPPPPPRAATASPASAPRAPPTARANTTTPSGPLAPSSGLSGMPSGGLGANGGAPPGSGLPPSRPPSGAPPSRMSGPPRPGSGSGAGLPGGGGAPPSLDDLLARPPSGRPTSAAAKKKGRANKYVDVFQQ